MLSDVCCESLCLSLPQYLMSAAAAVSLIFFFSAPSASTSLPVCVRTGRITRESACLQVQSLIRKTRRDARQEPDIDFLLHSSSLSPSSTLPFISHAELLLVPCVSRCCNHLLACLKQAQPDSSAQLLSPSSVPISVSQTVSYTYCVRMHTLYTVAHTQTMHLAKRASPFVVSFTASARSCSHPLLLLRLLHLNE